MSKSRPQCGLILENSEGKVLLQLRDDKKTIPYPNSLGTFGGQVEEGESPEEAIEREVREEIGYELSGYEYIGNYPFDGYEIHMYRKVDPEVKLSDLKVREGQCGIFVSVDDVREGTLRFAFNCRSIVADYFDKFS
jgi:8-oxo-dGTP diphosphatase